MKYVIYSLALFSYHFWRYNEKHILILEPVSIYDSIDVVLTISQ